VQGTPRNLEKQVTTLNSGPETQKGFGDFVGLKLSVVARFSQDLRRRNDSPLLLAFPFVQARADVNRRL